MTNQNPVTEYPDANLYEALRIARVPDRLANAAEKEVRDMAGDNIRAEIATMRAEVNGKFDAQSAEIRSTRWMISAVFALMATLTALGVFNTVFRLMQVD